MNRRVRINKTMSEIMDATDDCYSFVFTYEGKRYHVLGLLVALGRSEQVCLWADVLEIDKVEQKNIKLKVFYIEGLRSQVQRVKLHTECSNSWIHIAEKLGKLYAYGPQKVKNKEDQGSSGLLRPENPEKTP